MVCVTTQRFPQQPRPWGTSLTHNSSQAVNRLKLPESLPFLNISIKIMNKLSKAQKDELATSFAILALYDGEAEISSGQVSSLLQATGNTEVEPFYPIIFANFLSDPEKVATLIASPGAGSGGKFRPSIMVISRLWALLTFVFRGVLYHSGGGGGGGAVAGGDAGAAEEKEEEKVEEEEAEIGGGMDMFGGGDAGGGGDY